MAKVVPRLDCRSPVLPYGVLITSAGAGRTSGSVRSADNVMPSRSGIRTLNRRVSSAMVPDTSVSRRREAVRPGRLPSQLCLSIAMGRTALPALAATCAR